MRADRLAEVSAYPGFARLVERGLYLLGAMTEDGLRAAVEAPARQAGLLIEPGLVDLLVSEVAGTAGALPLLSHALLETWKRREGNTLTVEGYRRPAGSGARWPSRPRRCTPASDPSSGWCCATWCCGW